MELRDKIIYAGILLLTIGVIVLGSTAVVQRNKAVVAQAELDRRDQEERIDVPYQEALVESERKRVFLEKALEEKNKEAEVLRISLLDRERDIDRLGREYEELINNRPDKKKIEEEYRNADIKDICADFSDMGIPCEPISR